MPYNNLEEEIRTRLIYAGIDEPPQEAVNSMAELFSSKFSELEREIEKLYENEEARRRTYYPIDPPPHDHYWGNKMVDKYQEALSDVLKLFNRGK